MNLSELCEEVADVIRDRGWARGVSQDSNGCVCITHAVHIALRDNCGEEIRAVVDDLYWALTKLIPISADQFDRITFHRKPGVPIPTIWNDYVAKSVEDVLETLAEIGRTGR